MRARTLAAAAACALACARDPMNMAEQPKDLPYAPSAHYDDGQAMRPPEPGTVAQERPVGSEAYLTGRVAGRHKLAPRLSPKKTWEGLVGGAIAGIFVSFIALYDTRKHYLGVWQAVVLGFVVVTAAVIGDLFESALKRDLEVKDTGGLLGGHGGVLDRIDALLFAAPAAYFLVIAYGFH